MNPAVFHRRCLFLCLTFVVGLSGLSARLIYLQVVKATDYAKKSDRVSVRKQILKANRGCIVDCNNQLVARNIPRARLALDKKLLRDIGPATHSLANKELRETPEWQHWDLATRNRKIKARASKLKNEMQADVIIEQHIAHVINIFARPLGMHPHELRERMKLENEKQMYVVIKPDLSEDDADKLMELAREYSILHTFVFEEWQKRWYVMPTMASAIIGYVGEDENDAKNVVKGRAGIERKMNEIMAGRDGFVVTHRDKFELLAVAKPQTIRPPAHGLNVQLTLDMGMQSILEEELDAGLAEFKAQKGTIILMDPNTGAILAMASRPTYNLNTRENIAENGFDFATQAIYEPGSTFKIISTAGALDQGLVSPGTRIFCHHARYQVGSVKVPDHHPYGMLSVEEVLAKSSNIGAYKIALQLGRQKFFNYLHDFGFGAKTNILMAGESAGVVRDTGNPTDFSRVSYGYAVSVTPLQVACAYSAIANGGTLLEPQLLKSVMANNGAIIRKFKPKPVRRVIKESTAQKMRRALATVVDVKGTASRAKVDGFKVAGKTGTTVKINPGGGYLPGRYTVSFAGMMPAEKPAFVCVVVVDDPQTTEVKRYGGTIAAPIFAKVATRIANRMGLEPTEPIDPDSATQPLAQTSH
ncbi:MAG: penicillin-binding protein 2 [Akkermansiaceae bacterium]|nr:penicillin-binding protein 2 [Akkermansiaceae bacterium]